MAGWLGQHPFALSFRLPQNLLGSVAGPGCPPSAQSSPTASFLFNNACQKTHNSAPNRRLARGQGLASDLLTNHLARAVVPLHEQQLACPLGPTGYKGVFWLL